MLSPQTRKRYPYKIYFIIVLAIALMGLLDSIYLAISHYRNYADLTYQSFCAISRSFNCDTVSQSPYAILFGVPVPVWGIMGYALFLFLQILFWFQNAQHKRGWALLLLLSLTFSFYSLILAFISSYYIHSYCIMCILSYAVNLALLFYSWIICRRFGDESFISAVGHDFRYLIDFWKISLPSMFFFIVVSAVLMGFFPPYWQLKPPPLSPDVTTGATEDGYPWIGAENPELTIMEFSDYQCFQCRKMHYFLRRLISAHSTEIRLIHRHFPMDDRYNPLVRTQFHVGSGKMAIISLYAQFKNQFWKVSDFLFNIGGEKQDFNTEAISKLMNVSSGELVAAMKSKVLRLKLKHDIAMGLEYGISGTPSFVIDNKVYLGQIPADLLEKYLQ